MDKLFPRAAPPKPSALGWSTYEQAMGVLESQIRGKAFLLGDHFCTADLFNSALLAWAMKVKCGDLSPELLGYMGRCLDRPAAQRTFAALSR